MVKKIRHRPDESFCHCCGVITTDLKEKAGHSMCMACRIAFARYNEKSASMFEALFGRA